jgi:ATP-dependent helicase HrpA
MNQAQQMLRQQLKEQLVINYPAELPLSQVVAQIKELLARHQLIIVCGETGSGKTTQLPKILLELGLARHGIIGHTQPRRIAARSLAQRIAAEVAAPANGAVVGCKMRFHDHTAPTTLLKLMTDGILLQEIQRDRNLSQYSALIIDEVHERSLNIDFILGYLRQLLPKRPELKVIITSATLENEKLAAFFNQAPVLKVSGKTYPVDIIYQPYTEDEDEASLNQAIYKAIQAALAVEAGNGLVFLPGEREIKLCLNFLNKTELNRYELLPLFARQNYLAQNQVFNDNGRIKIILATNIAETSLTIPGIKFVIDSGVARVKRYSIRNRVEQLQIEAISQASSKQRAGRAGRLSHGLCVRLFSAEEFNLRQEFSTPELLRSNLANVILRLLSLNLGDPLQFAFLDQPQSKAFNDGFRTLWQVGAVDQNQQINARGRSLARIPIDVQLATILLAAAEKYSCLSEALIIVAFLAVQDPRETPIEHQALAKERHSIWTDKRSEFLQVLNLWSWYHEQLNHKKSNKKLLEICYKQFVSLQRLREWHELQRQLKEIMLSLNFHEAPVAASYQNLHSAILEGFALNIGHKDVVEPFYNSTNNRKVFLHPQINLSPSKWIVAVNLLETKRLFGRMCAAIEASWVENSARHLLKYSYTNQQWNKQRGEVTATRISMLYGLVISQKKVSYAPIDQKLAREIMIREAMVAKQLNKQFSFLEHNQQVIYAAEKMEDKLRINLSIIDEELNAFYQRVLPMEVSDLASLEQFIKVNPNALYLNQSEFLHGLSVGINNLQLYPEYLQLGEIRLPLKYRFTPQHSQDGVSALITLNQLNNLNRKRFTWLVPGMIREKCAVLLKALPKNQRILFNPAQESISEFLNGADQQQDFLQQFMSYAQQKHGINLDYLGLRNLVFPPHLCFHFQIMQEGNALAYGDDLEQLQQQLAPNLAEVLQQYTNQINNITQYVPQIANLLQEVRLQGGKLNGYYALKAEKTGVINLIVMPNYIEAQRVTRLGLISLVRLQLKEQQKYLHTRALIDFKALSLSLAPADASLVEIYSAKDLQQDFTRYVLSQAAASALGDTLACAAEQFNQIINLARVKVTELLTHLLSCLKAIATLYQQIKHNLTKHKLASTIYLQLDDLVYPHFLLDTKWNYLQNFPRYLQGIILRLEKYPKNQARDTLLENQIKGLYDKWYNYVEELEQKAKAISADFYEFKYKIEELRISLFAQELRTLYPVSLARLERELQQLYLKHV